MNDLLDVLSRLAVVRQLPLNQLAKPQDRCEQVVEVVRDTTCKPADRLHLLCLKKLPLELFSFGDVARDNRDTVELSSGFHVRQNDECHVDDAAADARNPAFTG